MSKENVRYNLRNTNANIYKLALIKSPSKKYRGVHFHKEAELILVLSGRIMLMVDDESVELTEGQSAYLGMNSIHRLSPTDTASEILVVQSPIGDRGEGELSYIDDENLRAFIRDRRTEPYALFLDKGNEFSEMLYKIEAEYSRAEECYETYIQGYLQIIVGFLGRNSVLSTCDGADNVSALKKIEPVAKYISENYMNRITLDALSESAGYDKYYICKLIRSALNITFTDYLCYVRLRCAERLLVSTDMPISQIVYQTGFSTPQNFFKVFKAMYGYTPHKYKMLYRPTGPT